MNTETRGTLSRRGNISQITNAFVEEVNAFSNTSTGYIIVSYAASPGQQSDNIQMLRLNINRNTVILDSSGQVISLSEIRPQTVPYICLACHPFLPYARSHSRRHIWHNCGKPHDNRPTVPAVLLSYNGYKDSKAPVNADNP